MESRPSPPAILRPSVAGRRAFQQKLVAGGIGIVQACRWRMRPDAEGERRQAVIFDIGLLDMAGRFGAGRAARAVIHIEVIGPVAEQLALKADAGRGGNCRRWKDRAPAARCGHERLACNSRHRIARSARSAALKRPSADVNLKPAIGDAGLGQFLGRRRGAILFGGEFLHQIVDLLVLLLQPRLHHWRRRGRRRARVPPPARARPRCALLAERALQVARSLSAAPRSSSASDRAASSPHRRSAAKAEGAARPARSAAVPSMKICRIVSPQRPQFKLLDNLYLINRD